VTSTKDQRLSYEHVTMAVVKMYVVPMIIKRKYDIHVDKHWFKSENQKYYILNAVLVR
jgi:hypothetical protein